MSDPKSATTRAIEATNPLGGRDGDVIAGVRELRDHLSKYLDVVKPGRTVTVTEHGDVIATIVPTQFSPHMPSSPPRPCHAPDDAQGRPADRPRIEIEGGYPGSWRGAVIAYVDTSALSSCRPRTGSRRPSAGRARSRPPRRSATSSCGRRSRRLQLGRRAMPGRRPAVEELWHAVWARVAPCR